MTKKKVQPSIFEKNLYITIAMAVTIIFSLIWSSFWFAIFLILTGILMFKEYGLGDTKEEQHKNSTKAILSIILLVVGIIWVAVSLLSGDRVEIEEEYSQSLDARQVFGKTYKDLDTLYGTPTYSEPIIEGFTTTRAYLINGIEIEIQYHYDEEKIDFAIFRFKEKIPRNEKEAFILLGLEPPTESGRDIISGYSKRWQPYEEFVQATLYHEKNKINSITLDTKIED